MVSPWGQLYTSHPFFLYKVTFGCQLWGLGQCVCCLSWSVHMVLFTWPQKLLPTQSSGCATWSLPFLNRHNWDSAILLSVHPDSIVLLPSYELFHCCEIGSCCVTWANPEYRQADFKVVALLPVLLIMFWNYRHMLPWLVVFVCFWDRPFIVCLRQAWKSGQSPHCLSFQVLGI